MSAQGERTRAGVGVGVGVDVVMALLTSGVVLLGWRSTYAGSGWWVAGLVAVVLAVSVAVIVRDLGGGGELVGLALVVGYVVVAGPLSRGTLALEGWDTFTDGLVGTGEIWQLLLTTHPPVDATGPALLPPIITALVGAGFSTSLALGSRRPVAPLLPFAAALAVVLLVGQRETASLLGLGAGTGVLSLVWVRVRALRLEDERLGPDPGRWRRSVVGALVVAVCAGVAFRVVGDGVGSGGADPDRFTLREQARPYAVSALRTPLTDFRELVRSNRRLLVVDGAPAGTRLRFAALDRYDGRTWSADNDTDPARTDDRFLHVSSTTDNPARGPERTVTVQVTKDWDRAWVPTVGAVDSFTVEEPDPGLRDDLRYDPATQTALLPDGLGRDVRYSFTTHDTELSATPRMTESPLLDDDLYRAGARVDKVITYWKREKTALTPMDAVFKVAAGIRSVGRYSHGAEPWERRYRAGHDMNRLAEGFLLDSPPVGDEEQYAAAMAVLANRMRVPARVVVGAVLPESGVVRGSDVTAWVELRADDGTWRTLDTDVFMSRRPPDRIGSGVAPDPTYDPLSEQPKPPPRTDPKDADDQASDSGSTQRSRPWWLLAVPLVLVLAGGVPGAKWLRRRRRRRAAGVSARYAGAWDELVDHARDLGFDVPAAARPTQAAALDGTVALALEADRRIYSADELDPHAADAYWSLVETEVRRLDAQTSRSRRVRALFSARSLRS
ncbi:DUF3488 and transglutaminase-like domain-containing protein [Nocardioides plantarum]|uniref:DUF3488 and transglutaminase-like domain-containing protein n=1 Tax=Nocardioides plantarum TaxID=29299 RepID=A0ABV5KG65_9ACTN|nr:transglutaminase domain-containing protein [Nocardioides plantarum]